MVLVAWSFVLWKCINMATTAETVHAAYGGVVAGVAVGCFQYALGDGNADREAEKAR